MASIGVLQPPVMQRQLARQVLRTDDAVTAADRLNDLNRGTLESVVSVGEANRAADLIGEVGDDGVTLLNRVKTENTQRLLSQLSVVDDPAETAGQLARLDGNDIGRVVDSYDAGTVSKVVSAGASGGSDGDDLLQKLADVAQAGKADDVQRLANNLDEDTLRYVLETDGVDPAVRLLDNGAASDDIAAIANRGEDLAEASRLVDNGLNPGDIDRLLGQLRGLRNQGSVNRLLPSGNQIRLEDLEHVARGPNDRLVYLIQTDKWKSSVQLVGDGLPDFKHIVARHAPEDATGDWPVTPGSEITSGTNTFPKTMSAEDVKEAIRIGAENGQIGDDAGQIVYSGSKLDEYGIDRIVIERNANNGQIYTAYPN